MPKPVSQTSPVACVDQDIGRLDVLVDETALVDLAQRRRRCAIARRRKLPTSMGAPSRPLERLAARVLEHQHGPPLVLHQRNRPHGPAGLERGPQRIFVLEPPQACRRGMLANRCHDENPGETTVRRARAHAPIEDARTILVERLERVVRKIDHGGLLCHTPAYSAGADAPARCTLFGNAIIDLVIGKSRPLPGDDNTRSVLGHVHVWGGRQAWVSARDITRWP